MPSWTSRDVIAKNLLSNSDALNEQKLMSKVAATAGKKGKSKGPKNVSHAQLLTNHYTRSWVILYIHQTTIYKMPISLSLAYPVGKKDDIVVKTT